MEFADIHKARLAHPDDPEDRQPCAVCRREVKIIAGGRVVHVDTGAVVGKGADPEYPIPKEPK